MLRTVIIALATPFLLVACEDVPQTPAQSVPVEATTTQTQPASAPTELADLTTAAAVIAADFDRATGANLGSLVIEGGRSEGNVAIMETRLIFARAYIARPQATRAFRRFVCEVDVYSAFIALGGEIHFEVRGFGGSGFSLYQIDRC